MDINQRIELIDRMAEVNGNSIISLDTQVVPLMNSTLGSRQPNPDYGHTIKCQTGSSVMVFQNKRVHGYRNMVHRRLIKEGLRPDAFRLSPRRWGTRIPNMPLVVHNHEYYLEMIYLRPGRVQYYVRGEPVDVSEVRGLRGATPPEQGGLSDKVILRVFKFSSIRRIKINGEVIEFNQT